MWDRAEGLDLFPINDEKPLMAKSMSCLASEEINRYTFVSRFNKEYNESKESRVGLYLKIFN